MSALKETVRPAPAVRQRPPDLVAQRRRAERALRTSRTIPAFLAASILTVAGGLVAADAGRVLLLGAPPRVVPHSALRALAWADPPMLVVVAAMLLAGGLLVAVGLLPGRVRPVPLESEDPLLAIGLTRRGLRRSLAATCASVPGVDRAQVRLRRDFVEVTVVSAGSWTGGIVPAVRAAAEERLCAMGVLRDRYVAVRLLKARV